MTFDIMFKQLTGHDPFPWQMELYTNWFSMGKFPTTCNLPTGLGKTNVIAVWLIALANGAKMPRRLVYVVNRRTVVDQATREAEKLRENLRKADLVSPLQKLCGLYHETPLAISTLRGQFADNGEWCADPTRPAVIIGTVDMIGSRLLFSGYGLGYKRKPFHAGLIGQDTLLAHDEAHLEPAFQGLLSAIQQEQQRSRELGSFHVLELSATTRGQETPFSLTPKEKSPPDQLPAKTTEPIHIVWQRIKARKECCFHALEDSKKLAIEMGNFALEQYRNSQNAVMVYVRKVEDAEKIIALLRKAKQQVQQLTGTLRGWERDSMVKDPIFIRFLSPSNRPKDVVPAKGIVYLICTSAGEVGVDISADHLISDLTPFDSMAQRFGRVNRLGEGDARIDVFHNWEGYTNTALNAELPPFNQACVKTLCLLQRLPSIGDDFYSANSLSLYQLPLADRLDAFTPTPTIVPVTDILLDAWALTSIRSTLPGRPSIEPYLHGICDWELPETHVAWREEVEVVTGYLLDRYSPEDLLEDYPLKPNEQLRDNSYRIYDRLKKLPMPKDTSIWLMSNSGSIEPTTLGALLDSGKESIYYKTVLLPPKAGGLDQGMLSPTSKVAEDISGHWYDDKGRQRRTRVWDTDPEWHITTKGMRLIRQIKFQEGDEGDESETSSWLWFERPANAENEGSQFAREPVAWQDHTDDVFNTASRITEALEQQLPKDIRKALQLAAKFHDLGKKRELWQLSIGNPDPQNWLAKSGRKMKPIGLTHYRHEFGSLLDIEKESEFQKQTDEMKDLILHVIAAHHGWARPHFEPRGYDPPPTTSADNDRTAIAVLQRFGRLQQRYGRWGLAYLESILRAADYTASAYPSNIVEDKA